MQESTAEDKNSQDGRREGVVHQTAPVIVGEALVDEFVGGRHVVGGAPLNVAWNLGGFGLRPRFVSAVGNDPVGREILEALERWGLCTEGIVTRDDHSTGVVRVSLEEGQPSYEIVFPVAYDFLPGPDFFAGSEFLAGQIEGSLEDAGPLLYLGSLAWRREESRSVLREWVGRFGGHRFVDINIREPWFEESIVDWLVAGARYVKLNDEELSRLTGGLPCGTDREIEEAVERFRQRHGGEVLFVTCGSRGAYAITKTEVFFAAAPRPEPLRDTVGAGDAFAASVIAGLSRQESLQQCIERGVRFAARICSINGATSENRDLYREEVES